MTPLRQQMITAMQVRGFSPRTHQAYLQAVQGLARYYKVLAVCDDVECLTGRGKAA